MWSGPRSWWPGVPARRSSSGRFVVVVRAVLPGLVGMSGMPRRIFTVFSAVGGLVWGTLWVLVGFGLGLSYTKVTRDFGWGSLVVLAALLVAWLVVERRRLRRRHRSGPAGPP